MTIRSNMPATIATHSGAVSADTRRSQNDRWSATFTRRHGHIAAAPSQPEVV